MPDVNLLAVLVATVAAFLLGATYYAVFGEQLAEVSDAAAAGEQPPPWKLAVELLRCLVLAAVVAGARSPSASPRSCARPRQGLSGRGVRRPPDAGGRKRGRPSA